MSLNFNKWWDNHGKHNVAEFDWNASDRRRVRELMKLAFEVGAEGKAKKDKSKDTDPRDSFVKTVDIINDR